ncbi:MAG: ECF transporter S component [Oscillospiraceae bacterium]
MENTAKTTTLANSNTKKLIQIAMLSAVALVIYYLDFPVPLMPPFIKLDLSNVVCLFAGFTTGPVGGVLVCLIKNVIHVAIKGFGTTMGIGDIFDFVTSAALTLTASLIYKKNHTKKGAVIGCVIGTLVFAGISLPLNYFIVYPIYAKAFGGMEAIMSAYQAILPSVGNIFSALCIFNLPFTIVKGILCAAVTIVIYKPLITALRKAHIID